LRLLRQWWLLPLPELALRMGRTENDVRRRVQTLLAVQRIQRERATVPIAPIVTDNR
jgi:hypothetical protein